MDKNREHIDQRSHESGVGNEIFRKLEIPWGKSKSDVWGELSERIDEKPEVKVRKLNASWVKIPAAAVIILLIGVSAFIRLYTKTVYCPEGQTLTAQLPDGSEVKMSAVTTIKFQPYWWNYSRNVKMEGEAYFSVKKGKRFVVSSSLGKTQVLGTSFSIYSRGNDYNVTCITGSVRVISAKSRDEKVLTPNERAEIINNRGDLKVTRISGSTPSARWIGNTFTFTSMPLKDVLNEIERQYGVDINIEEGLDIIYSGNFTKEDSVEDVLDLVCRSLGIKFAKTSGNTYQVERIR